MQALRLLAGTSILAVAASAASAQTISLNEVYISELNTDTHEFYELVGPPSASLAGYMLLYVEGDTGTTQGRLKVAIDLGTYSLRPSGYFVIGDSTLTPDITIGTGGPPTANGIENGTATMYLVTTTNQAAISALVNTDVRVAAGTTTTIPTLATIVDIIAVSDAGAGDQTMDGATVIGPDPLFPTSVVPGIFRPCDAPAAWSLNAWLDFDPLATSPVLPPTPGAKNVGCPIAPGTSFCEPNTGGVIACPCGNNGAAGKGCENSAATGGAQLSGTGSASTLGDTLVMTATGIASAGPSCVGFNQNLTSILLQGTTLLAAGVPFGDGVRCFGGALKRINVGVSSAGTYNFGPGVLAQSTALGDPLVSGDTRYYLVYYRDSCPTFCPSSNFDATQGYMITWQ